MEDRYFADIPAKIARYGDCFRVYQVVSPLRAGLDAARDDQPVMDFVEHPAFVHELFGDHRRLEHRAGAAALTYDIDAIYFGDD